MRFMANFLALHCILKLVTPELYEVYVKLKLD
jgi:hypothetical protein